MMSIATLGHVFRMSVRGLCPQVDKAEGYNSMAMSLLGRSGFRNQFRLKDKKRGENPLDDYSNPYPLDNIPLAQVMT